MVKEEREGGSFCYNTFIVIRKIIESAIHKTLKDLGILKVSFSIEHPDDPDHGDFSANVALVVSKELGKDPRDMAEKIADTLRSQKVIEIDRIEVAGPGFVNIFLSRDFFTKSISQIIKDPEFGKTEIYKGKKVMVEYTDPNPFKEFHIGHLMPNAIGESIARLYEWNGARVQRVNYQGDVGLHVAKVLWKVKNDGLKTIENVQASALGYVGGAKSYEEDETAKREIQEINKKIYDRSDAVINKLYDSGKKTSLDYFETIYRKLGTKFDYSFFESETGKIGEELVRKNIPNVFEASEGAIIFKGEKHSLHTRVFITKEGLPTYEAKELGLAFLKEKTYPSDISVVVTANEIKDYFRVLLKALSIINSSLAEKTVHISHGILRLPSGKMSSRTGDVITAETLIADVSGVIRSKMKNESMGKNEREKIIEEIAIGAIKFSILRQSIGKDIVFDFDKSLSFEGDSGPYLQYTAVRARSVLEKGKEVGKISKANNAPSLVSTLERLLCRLPEIMERSGKNYAPQLLVSYLLELAGAFNAYYAYNRIIDDSTESPYRLALTQATATVIENGLSALGIKVPEKM